MLLRGLAKLVAVVVVAGGAGIVLGIGFAALAGDDDLPTPVDETATRADDPTGPVRVRVIDAVLRPAGSRAGRERQHARLSVEIRVANDGERPETLARPALLVGDKRVETDPGADGPDTSLESLEAGESAAVTLRFEVAGAVTTQLTTQRRARIVVAGRTLPVPFEVGEAVEPSADSADPDP